MNEVDVSAKAFDLIFAFDEIIALGYPENVNLSQVRTYTEMHSHDEAIYKMVKEVCWLAGSHLAPAVAPSSSAQRPLPTLGLPQNKEREAKDTMKRKAKELQMQKRMRERMGGRTSCCSSPAWPCLHASPNKQISRVTTMFRYSSERRLLWHVLRQQYGLHQRARADCLQGTGLGRGARSSKEEVR